MPTKVLVADVPEMDRVIRDCLPGHDLLFVRTMREAVAALRRDGFRVVVIGLHFDESRMIELLSYVRTMRRYDDAAVICVQGIEVALPEAVLKSIDVAVKALGGTAFLDLRDHSELFRQHCGLLGRVADGAHPRPS
jgi:CheY-like chemotaxis protein